MNEIIINKIQSIQRCIERARQEYYTDPDGFATNYTIQDAAVLNILRACEQAIDLSNHIIKSHKMGIPTSSGESFDLLQQQAVIEVELAGKLRKMVHFRNMVIHHYHRMDIEIVRSVIITDSGDLLQFGDQILAFVDKDSIAKG